MIHTIRKPFTPSWVKSIQRLSCIALTSVLLAACAGEDTVSSSSVPTDPISSIASSVPASSVPAPASSTPAPVSSAVQSSSVTMVPPPNTNTGQCSNRAECRVTWPQATGCRDKGTENSLCICSGARCDAPTPPSSASSVSSVAASVPASSSSVSSQAASSVGGGLSEQAQRGKDFYAAQCVLCHGPSGDGGGAGQTSFLASITVGTMVSKTAISMPLQDATLCNLNCAKDIKAWLVGLHGIDTGDSSSDAASSAPAQSFQIRRSKAEDVYRRASILFGQGVPSVADLEDVKGANYGELKAKLKGLMTGNGFREFIKTGANDQLLMRGILGVDYRFWFLNYYPKFRELVEAEANRFIYDSALVSELREEPLELIHHVVKNNLPYTEILTADYTMVSHEMSRLYNYPTPVAKGRWVKGQNTGQHVSTANGLPSKDWNNSRLLDFPHVGILSSIAYLNKYPSTATNRNRARSRWTMYHFLGYDIEASAPRVNIDDADDSENPTLNNPACTICHITMDPIAAGFQDFNDKGLYRTGNRALDSLSRDYKKTDLYENGQTWYADVLPAGFNGEDTPQGEEPLRWLAEKLVADPRFGPAVVKFWWPAIFGEKLYATKSDEELVKQQEFVVDVAKKFKNSNWNLKDLLANLLMSDWYRANNLAGSGDNTEAPLTYSGNRLLTPEEMVIKQKSLFDNAGLYDANHSGAFGGIDSVNIESRDRNMNVVKMNVVKANSYRESCSIAFKDFDKPKATRSLFPLVELSDEAEPKIRAQLVYLHERLLNERHGPNAKAINEAYALFTKLKENAEARGNTRLIGNDYLCAGERNKNNFDTKFTFAAWKGVLVALSSDYQFITE
ncbi:DUF1588 domain-containing protein [Marinagarivorans algicola]|uniref:DUF1588 domain-containing protein n=1 Tax=Marinagarivorans algicola TaxID=1513270 RepID=UPI0009EAB97B|nr:DUF1588 domain-containing protein [Marinagarivorans algicola]